MRGPDEPVDAELEAFYERLLALLRQPRVRYGRWRLLECAPAAEGNGSAENFVAFAWEGAGGERLLVAVNQAPHQSQCFVRLPFTDLAGREWRLQDEVGSASYDREGSDLATRGLYLDSPAWQACAFSLAPRP